VTPSRREEALVHLAFMAQAAMPPALADAAEDAARRLQVLLTARDAHAMQTSEPASRRRTRSPRLRLLLDGLAIQLVTTQRRNSAK